VDVVPVVVNADVLSRMYLLVDGGGSSEPVLGLGVVAATIEDVAGMWTMWPEAGARLASFFALSMARSGCELGSMAWIQ